MTDAALAAILARQVERDSPGVSRILLDYDKMVVHADTPVGVIDLGEQDGFTGTIQFTLRNKLITPRSLVIPGMIVEYLGVTYAGTIGPYVAGYQDQGDGHIDLLASFFTAYTGPVLVLYQIFN